jgi:hypothetical protein
LEQTEVNEIAQAFLDAWEEYFGQTMYYVKFISADKHPLYGESKNKTYDFANKLSFYGTFKQEPIEEKGDIGGKDVTETAEITFVTKELEEKGLEEVNHEDIIEITDKNGITKTYNIVDHYGKVQFGSSRVFTKLKVVDKNAK